MKQPAPKLQAKASPKEVRRQPESQHFIRISSNSNYLGIETCCQESIDRYISCTEVSQTCNFKCLITKCTINNYTNSGWICSKLSLSHPELWRLPNLKLSKICWFPILSPSPPRRLGLAWPCGSIHNGHLRDLSTMMPFLGVGMGRWGVADRRIFSNDTK